MFLESVKYCQANKGLEVFAWCIMPSHIHLILRSAKQFKLIDTIRDLKSFTSRKIRLLLENDLSIGESRRNWMYKMFQHAGIKNSNNYDFQFW